MFITIPKVFANMGFGTVIGILFFLLVLFAALTSSIALTESAVSTFEDELGWGRKKSTVLIGVIMIALGTPLLPWLRTAFLRHHSWHAVPGFLRLPDELRDDANCCHCHLSSRFESHRCGKNRGRNHPR